MKETKVYEFRNAGDHCIQVEDISIRHATYTAQVKLSQMLTDYVWISDNNPRKKQEPASLTVIKWGGKVLRNQTWRYNK